MEGVEKGKKKVLLECMQCEQRRLECEHGSGKSPLCKACIEAKVVCWRLGAEGSEKVMKQRKRMEGESPRGKRKRAQTTEESEVGSSVKTGSTLRQLWNSEVNQGVWDFGFSVCAAPLSESVPDLRRVGGQR